MTGDKFTGLYSKYNEDDLPGTRVEPYDEKYVKRLESEIETLEKRCKEADKRAKPYGMTEWKGGEEARASYIERITALEKALAESQLAVTTLQEVNEYLEKLCTEQDRKLRGDIQDEQI